MLQDKQEPSVKSATNGLFMVQSTPSITLGDGFLERRLRCYLRRLSRNSVHKD